ncbi:sugar phosphate nucleotidyltransferase [Acidobacteria bacterium AH-259-O06]|nr:sugar phosphate nucleotidyltransferase [Acidobacteria bacterium AH-259-O06]
MQAVLMAGGLGTRFRSFTAVLPKPLVPIGDISIIELVLRQLRGFGFEAVIVSVGYKAELIMAVVGDGRQFGLEVRYQKESKPLGTIGALALMKDLEENFLVMNGDICTNLNFAEIYRDHVASNATATVGAYARREKIELGVLDLDSSGRIISFREKPTYDFHVSMGVNVFNHCVLNLIPAGEFFGFDMLMHAMLGKGIAVRPYFFDGLWLDIGRPDDYNRMVEDYAANPGAYLPEGV